MKYLRDEFGFDFLVDVTAIDWAEGVSPRFTVVYHLLFDARRTTTSASRPTARTTPSRRCRASVELWAGANWHERETYDMFGIKFTGHPDLRRILMWDGYPYLPLRKEFPLAGIETRAARCRSRRGDAGAKVIAAPMVGGPFVASPGEINLPKPSRARRTRAGTSAARNRNDLAREYANAHESRHFRTFASSCDSRAHSERWPPNTPFPTPPRRAAAARQEFETEKMSLSMGPSHPSTHGVLRLQMELDGEILTKCDPVLGYLHRGDEKIAENMTYNQFVPYTDRLDYLAPLANNMAYAIAVERLAKLEVPAALPGDPRDHGGTGAHLGAPDGPRRLRHRCRRVDGVHVHASPSAKNSTSCSRS